MTHKKIVLAGGTGYVGNYLRSQFQSQFNVVDISRQPGHISWADRNAIQGALEGAEMLINLAGKSVNCRYTEKNKAAIFSSRTETTQLLGEAVSKCVSPPELWINSSTATIYRHAEDRPMTEAGGEIGSGFSVEVARKWEETFFSFQLPRTRQVALRMAIVLGATAGVLPVLTKLVRRGLGGTQGNGKQMFSWIHEADLHKMILFIKDRKNLHGVFNASAPNPVNNATLMRMLREDQKVQFGLSSPAWLLKVGAVFMQTQAELVLKSRWALPERILQEGFQFTFPELQSALHDISSAKS